MNILNDRCSSTRRAAVNRAFAAVIPSFAALRDEVEYFSLLLQLTQYCIGKYDAARESASPPSTDSSIKVARIRSEIGRALALPVLSNVDELILNTVKGNLVLMDDSMMQLITPERKAMEQSGVSLQRMADTLQTTPFLSEEVQLRR